jgi:hypothetical protein
MYGERFIAPGAQSAQTSIFTLCDLFATPQHIAATASLSPLYLISAKVGLAFLGLSVLNQP